MSLPLSILDLATVGRDESVADSLANSVALARRAEELGYRRVWYAEHHNIRGIASSATSVLIGHVAAHTSTIRLGSGGVMLPNHAPLMIAEQFGTLETLHPGRIDLGLGRAPGTDQNTLRALRRDPRASETFPRDVQELQGYLGDETLVEGVNAIPGRGTHVPLHILGSSLFGAKVAAALGLPYAFASHFAPDALEEAVAAYRAEFRPSEQCSEPYVIAGLNVIAADDDAQAQREFQIVKRARLKMLMTGGRTLTEEQADQVLDSPQSAPVHQMVKYSAVGTADTVGAYLDDFAKLADADELIVAHQPSTLEGRLRSAELLAGVRG
ncbi:LLM class flavin-dependent oxidoreductase [Pseudonocardia nantongensis]|uniref:LLM class flavin-dependent oxidoreductase n=1 Tax=Pseudonocardia nantongensis TaxID=1181885 RepID=UPI00397D061E